MRYTTNRPAPVPRVVYVLGLDLGKVSDYSALAVLERRQAGKEEPTFAANYLHRWPIGTSYPQVVEGVARVLKSEPLAGSRSSLVIDATGPGLPVADMFLKADLGPRYSPPVYEPGATWRDSATEIKPVVITGGHRENIDGGTWHVPKRVLVGVAQVALQNQRLKIASQLPEAETLAKELRDFQLTITESANDTYEGRKGSHDDLVLALALALWEGFRWHEPEPHVRSYSWSMFGENSYDHLRRRR